MALSFACPFALLQGRFYSSFKNGTLGGLGGSAVWSLPLAQGAILESWDQVPRRAPGMEPVSPSACVSASLCLSVSHE